MKGPVAIGGIGGSGTRIVAQILSEAGIYMGGHLNKTYDNLWFTLLFKRPHWLDKAGANGIKKAIGIFNSAMHGELKPTIAERIFIYTALFEFINRHYIKSKEWRSLPMEISRTLIHSKKNTLDKYTHWGWKEPNTHLFLQPLADFYPELKYIHVIRHGLDMAYSSNQIQLRFWGKKAGIKYPTDSSKLPAASLDYWIWANTNAIKNGHSLFKENFLLINLENFCFHPKQEVEKLFSFLEINPRGELMNKLIQLPKLPVSTGRYKKENISVFTATQLNAVKEMGYDINL